MHGPGGVRPGVMGVVLSVASCLIVSTNLLVAAALLRLLLRRRSQSWAFVLNLALADALVGVAITGLASEDFDVARSRPAGAAPPGPGKSRCLLRMALVMSPCTASILSMFLISLDRYAAIKTPLRYARLSGRGPAVTALLALWGGAITVGFLPVMVRQLQAEGYDGFCAFFSVVHQQGMILLLSACFFPLLCVFVFIYLDILKIACGHQKQICQDRRAGCRTTGCRQHRQHRQHRQQHHYWSHVKALRTVAVLVGCFLLLWCPFFVACVVHVLCERCELAAVLENFLWLLGLSNSLMNPVLYACWQREVRLQLAAMFCCSPGPPGVTDRRDPPPPPPPLTRDGSSAGDAINPSLLPAIVANDKTDGVSPCETTGF